MKTVVYIPHLVNCCDIAIVAMLYINNLFILLEIRSPARFSRGSIASIRFEICVHRFCTTKLSCFLSIKRPEKSWVQQSFTEVSAEIVEHTGNSVNSYLQEVFGNHQLLFCWALRWKSALMFHAMDSVR
jgi:hypothetical protein